MYHSFFTSLTPQTLVLTPSRRLARHLLEAYADHQRQQGNCAWRVPRIMSLTDWLEELWQLLIQLPISDLAGKRLTEGQEVLIWEQAVKDSPQGELLLRPLETARAVMQAWHAICEWQIPLSQVSAAASIDTQALLDFAERVNTICRKQGWLGKTDIITLRLKHLAEISDKNLPEVLFLCAFESLTPAISKLMAHMAERGIKVQEIYPPAINQHAPLRYVFNDEKNEWDVIARWAKQLLADGQKNIGIIVPNLKEAWLDIERIFTSTLLPESLLNSEITYQRPFNISGGQPLSKMPVIAAVFTIIQFFCEPLATEDLAQFLALPFLGGSETETTLRAQLAASFIQQGVLSVSWQTLLAHGEQQERCPLLAQHLMAAAQIWPSLSQQQTPGYWLQLFNELLKAMGWPGERAISSAEYQAIDHFLQVTLQFAALEEVKSQISAPYALALLRRELNSAVFQIQTENKPIQILGPLEAAGLTFDHLWLVGLTDTIWPAVPMPYPFIPLVLQHQYHLPHTSNEWELAIAKCLTERFLKAAPKVIVSYALAEDGGGGSALIQHIPLADVNTLVLAKSIDYAKELMGSVVLENIIDHQAPAFSTLFPAELPGGVRVLQSQALCPFKAFAEHRLAAIAAPCLQWGLSYRERGIILHLGLAYIWQQLKDSATLMAIADDDLRMYIKKSVSKAIYKLKFTLLKNSSKPLLQLEQQRLAKHIYQLLLLEKKREPFTVVAAEESIEITIGPLKLQLRVDRIDQLANDDYVVIDYKSGQSSMAGWFDERIDDPQLPLYALFLDKSVSALAFAQVQAQKVEFKGLAKEEHILPGVKPVSKMPIAEWSLLLEHWQQALTHTAEQFYQGHAEPLPKNGEQTCRSCHLQSLCRLY